MAFENYRGAPRPTVSFSLTKVFGIGLVGIATIFVLFSLGSIAENVDANEIVVIQAPFSGKLSFHTHAGTVWQGFGKVTSYPKRAQYEFKTPVRFNDGGHGVMDGSIQWEMPLDDANLTALHSKFGSAEAIQKALVEKVVNKSVYMTGPLMSSKESYAEKRNYLINYVEDQIANGVYKTVQKEVRVKDELTGTEKTQVVVDILQANGQPQRQEESALGEFGIRTFNFAINNLPYDEAVEAQIKQQQQLTMDVQTSVAQARKSEQRAITVEQDGKAAAAEAKWKQEVVKAEQVTAAESRVAVAKLNNEEAEQYRQSLLKKADGEATYKKRIMEADGALEQRLAAQVEIAKAQAEALGKIQVPIVPSTVFGGGEKGGDSVTDLFKILTLQAAQAVGLKQQ